MFDKNFFGFDTDVYLCFAYIPPQFSSYNIDQNIDFLELIENDISAYKCKGSVIILCELDRNMILFQMMTITFYL